MNRVEQGCFLIADIGGYTKFLSGSELEHSQDIVADLVGIVTKELAGPFHLAKLEGDAAFCYMQDEDQDASMLVAAMDAAYSGFQRRLLNIDLFTNCQCMACSSIPTLTLKFVAHHGEFLKHEVSGSEELIGKDVIVVHRLLKNDVSKKTGLKGYALLTSACVEAHNIDSQAMNMIEHSESYEEIGEVKGYVIDYETRWAAQRTRDRVFIGPDHGHVMSDWIAPVAPAVLWDYLTSPKLRKKWQADVLRVDQQNPNGLRGVGTTNHCVHGGFSVKEEIIDWSPFQYFSYRTEIPKFGTLLFTQQLTPVDDGTRTHVLVNMQLGGGMKQRMMWKMMKDKMKAGFDVSKANLLALLEQT